jgi:hypothetical protein
MESRSSITTRLPVRKFRPAATRASAGMSRSCRTTPDGSLLCLRIHSEKRVRGSTV